METLIWIWVGYSLVILLAAWILRICLWRLFPALNMHYSVMATGLMLYFMSSIEPKSTGVEFSISKLASLSLISTVGSATMLALLLTFVFSAIKT
jgi:hypothetical protein